MDKRFKIAAYVADWAFHEDITEENAAKITHINYSFGRVKDGAVSISHLQNADKLLRAHKLFPHLKINLSVGGWTADGFSQAVRDEEGREKLAQSAIPLFDALPLTGIDWDWEYPGSDEAGIAFSKDDPENMTKFLVRMREILDARGDKDSRYLSQSIAVGAPRVQDYLWKDALPALDSVNLMTYDMAMTGRAAHHTNLYPSENAAYSAQNSVCDFVRAGVPKDKLFIGAAFYFHQYLGVTGEGSGLTLPMRERGQGVSYAQFKAEEDSYARFVDEKACASAYRRGDTVLTGDDVDSLKAKGAYIRREGLGGIIIWEYNHDLNGELFTALYDGLQ